jgi:tetratricopeptide (TPR) repeat protein
MLGFAVMGASIGRPRVYFEETVLLGRRVGSEQAVAYVLCNIADLQRLAGELDEPLELLHEAVARFESIGDCDGEALALSRLGCLLRVRGEHRESRDALHQSLRLREAVGDSRAIGMARGNLGLLTAAEGDVEAGCALLERVIAGFRATEDEAGRRGVTLTVASILAEAGALADAEGRLLEALPSSRMVPGNHRAVGWAYAMLSDVQRRLGRDAAADRASREASVIFESLGAVDGATYLRGTTGTRKVGVKRMQSEPS